MADICFECRPCCFDELCSMKVEGQKSYRVDSFEGGAIKAFHLVDADNATQQYDYLINIYDKTLTIVYGSRQENEAIPSEASSSVVVSHIDKLIFDEYVNILKVYFTVGELKQVILLPANADIAKGLSHWLTLYVYDLENKIAFRYDEPEEDEEEKKRQQKLLELEEDELQF